MAQVTRRDVGELLVQGRVISQEQLHQARELESRTGIELGAVLIQNFGVKPFQVLQARAYLANMRAFDLSAQRPDGAAINAVPAAVCQRLKVLPVAKLNQNGQDVLVLALGDISNVMAVDDVSRACRMKVQPVLADPELVAEFVERHYPSTPVPTEAATPAQQEASSNSMLSEINSAVGEIVDTSGGDLDEAGDESATVQGPVIRIAHTVIQNAVTMGASDIHIEPGVRNVRVRYRVDGVLHEVMTLPKYVHPPLSSRYKIMSEMNIAERRVPQDGRIGINFQNKDYDLRVSCLPTQFGEKIVMRILDKGNVMIGLNRLGFFPDTLTQLEMLFSQPNGMLLATGPTGAGKSTTLYSVLNRVNSVERNILTVEDPVEYQLPGVSQVHVNRKAGLSFGSALRSFMRQDPDIIMVGEIRDLETAELAIQAALTGHLVLSTLHTNDAPSSVTRLVDMGVEPFLVSATLIGALAQRLGRRICDKCKETYEVPAESIASIGYRPQSADETIQLARGRGCENCRQSGYKGRIGIYELMTVNTEISELMVRRAPVTEITAAARANGMKTLKDDGLRKVLAGITTPEEVSRVVFTAGH
jgi:type IV pilus assembly protein PilB